MRLSAVLIVKDEEEALPDCLASLRGVADEIVVVDSGSRDATIEIARRAGARVLERTFDGFGPQKQFALSQAAGEWILSIDADERLTPRLAGEIGAIVSGRASPPRASEAEARSAPSPGAPRPEAYAIRREVWFLGHRLRYGGMQRDRVVRLVRRGCARVTAASVHERIEVAGETGHLAGTIEHHTHRTIRRYVEKANLYSSLAAADAFARGRRFHAWMHLRPAWELFRRLVLYGGFLDGQAGILYAGLSAYSAWLRALKLRELCLTAERSRSSREDDPATSVRCP